MVFSYLVAEGGDVTVQQRFLLRVGLTGQNQVQNVRVGRGGGDKKGKVDSEGPGLPKGSGSIIKTVSWGVAIRPHGE